MTPDLGTGARQRVPAGDHPPASLARILNDFGGILELLCGDIGSPKRIGGLVIHDPLDPLIADRHELVLAVGRQDPVEVCALLEELAPQHPAGVVLRSPVTQTTALVQAVERTQVPLIGLVPGVSWTQLAAVLGTTLDSPASDEMLGGVPSGDLFALANAIAAVLDAPVTIEDRAARVLAFSGRQDEVDPSRVETILNREVSAARTAELERRGVFRQLYGSEKPVFIEPPARGLEGFTMPRMALAVRASDEILGSIWAAVREPMSEALTQTFQELGPLVALHLMRERAGADVERRLRADLVATALEGGAAAAGATDKLGVAKRPAIVLALATDDDPSSDIAGESNRLARRRRLADALAMHLSVVAPGSVAAVVGDVIYGIVPVRGQLDGANQRISRLADDFVKRSPGADELRIGIGSVAEVASDLPLSRDGADRALRVLRAGHGPTNVACIEDVAFLALLTDFGDLLAANAHSLPSPLARLVAFDAEHRANLVQTLAAWLDAFGDVNAAARATFVHPNTLRYRLKRLTEIAELDLGDPDTRLSLMLQLRLIAQQQPAVP